MVFDRAAHPAREIGLRHAAVIDRLEQNLPRTTHAQSRCHAICSAAMVVRRLGDEDLGYQRLGDAAIGQRPDGIVVGNEQQPLSATQNLAQTRHRGPPTADGSSRDTGERRQRYAAFSETMRRLRTFHWSGPNLRWPALSVAQAFCGLE